MAIRLERLGDVARVTLANPPMNQLDRQSRDELIGLLERLAADRTIRVLLLTGDGHLAFCAGADIRDLAGLEAGEGPGVYAEAWDDLYRLIREFPCPTVAVVGGYALGGGFEILLNTDIRIAAEHAKLGCTAANIGLVTSLHSLATQLPMPVAKELFFTARHITAGEAHALGLINRVVPRDELAGATAEIVEQIRRKAPLALERGKVLLHQAMQTSREEHDHLQQHAFSELAATADHKEGVRAFLAKRRPEFTGY